MNNILKALCALFATALLHHAAADAQSQPQRTPPRALRQTSAAPSYPPAATAHQPAIVPVAFWNLENLFDYVRDHAVRDEDFTPRGRYRWTPDRYRRKLDNIARAISRLAAEHCPGGPAVIGVAEVENLGVLEDLVARPDIAARGYGIIHRDSPDRRGIDCALLYRPSMFAPDDVRTYRFRMDSEPDYRTRDQLLVSGTLTDGAPEGGGMRVHFIVCHWPSRYGGRRSAKLRAHAASITRGIVDSLAFFEPGARIVIMGDLNDDPSDRSCRTVLGARRTRREALRDTLGGTDGVRRAGLLNATWELHRRGAGTLVWRGRWNLFDQMIVSDGLLGGDTALPAAAGKATAAVVPPCADGTADGLGGNAAQPGAPLHLWRVEVFNRDFLIRHGGRGKGGPLRTFDGDAFADGYSDHLPVIIYLIGNVRREGRPE